MCSTQKRCAFVTRCFLDFQAALAHLVTDCFVIYRGGIEEERTMSVILCLIKRFTSPLTHLCEMDSRPSAVQLPIHPMVRRSVIPSHLSLAVEMRFFIHFTTPYIELSRRECNYLRRYIHHDHARMIKANAQSSSLAHATKRLPKRVCPVSTHMSIHPSIVPSRYLSDTPHIVIQSCFCISFSHHGFCAILHM